jgi:hypothetical protein
MLGLDQGRDRVSPTGFQHPVTTGLRMSRVRLRTSTESTQIIDKYQVITKSLKRRNSHEQVGTGDRISDEIQARIPPIEQQEVRLFKPLRGVSE